MALDGVDRTPEPQGSPYDQAVKLMAYWRETAPALHETIGYGPLYLRWADIVEEACDQRWLEGFEAGKEAAEA